MFAREHGEIAQLVERWIEDPSVGGSIPSLPTIKNQFDFLKKLLYNIYVRLKKKKKYAAVVEWQTRGTLMFFRFKTEAAMKIFIESA